jgi:hypothetical protein
MEDLLPWQSFLTVIQPRLDKVWALVCGLWTRAIAAILELSLGSC